MSQARFVRGSQPTVTSNPHSIDGRDLHERRRRSAHPRTLIARGRPAAPRSKKTFTPKPLPYSPRLASMHDFGDGRIALEFEGPSLDLMLYHDRGVTIAEWVTIDGELVGLVVVGEC